MVPTYLQYSKLRKERATMFIKSVGKLEIQFCYSNFCARLFFLELAVAIGLDVTMSNFLNFLELFENFDLSKFQSSLGLRGCGGHEIAEHLWHSVWSSKNVSIYYTFDLKEVLKSATASNGLGSC